MRVVSGIVLVADAEADAKADAVAAKADAVAADADAVAGGGGGGGGRGHSRHVQMRSWYICMYDARTLKTLPVAIRWAASTLSNIRSNVRGMMPRSWLAVAASEAAPAGDRSAAAWRQCRRLQSASRGVVALHFTLTCSCAVRFIITHSPTTHHTPRTTHHPPHTIHDLQGA